MSEGFATSAAIVISCIASMYFFDFHLSLEFEIGSTLVIIATFMYARYAPAPPARVVPFTAAKTYV